MYLAGIRDKRNKGNESIYIRLRNINAYFYNFMTLGWDAKEGVGSRIFLLEKPDSDLLESRYVIGLNNLPSGGPYILEYVRISDKRVIGEESIMQEDYRLDTMVALSNKIYDIQSGNWEISGTQMIFYDRNNIEIMRYNLTDKLGQPSDHNVFKREKV